MLFQFWKFFEEDIILSVRLSSRISDKWTWANLVKLQIPTHTFIIGSFLYLRAVESFFFLFVETRVSKRARELLMESGNSLWGPPFSFSNSWLSCILLCQNFLEQDCSYGWAGFSILKKFGTMQSKSGKKKVAA